MDFLSFRKSNLSIDFDKVNIFSFMDHIFGVIFKKPLLYGTHVFTPMFSFKCVLRAVTHFELTFVPNVRTDQGFAFYTSLVVLAPFLQHYSLSIKLFIFSLSLKVS